MADALKLRQLGDQKFAAPDSAVEPEPEPIECDADRRTLRAVIGQACGNMGMMVLHADELDAFQFERVFRREVLRMQVVGDNLRLYVEQPSKMIDTLTERAQGFKIFQVADVMRDESMLPLRDAKRVL